MKDTDLLVIDEDGELVRVRFEEAFNRTRDEIARGERKSFTLGEINAEILLVRAERRRAFRGRR